MHTCLSSCAVINMEDRIGNFEIDKEFDALLIDVTAPGSAVDVFSKVSSFSLFTLLTDLTFHRSGAKGETVKLNNDYFQCFYLVSKGEIGLNIIVIKNRDQSFESGETLEN